MYASSFPVPGSGINEDDNADVEADNDCMAQSPDYSNSTDNGHAARRWSDTGVPAVACRSIQYCVCACYA